MIDVFNSIAKRQTTNVMKHLQLADMFDFLNLRGEKRQQEYHAFEEWAELRATHRYAINHLYRLIDDKGVEIPALIPASWFTATKKDVSNDNRRQYTKMAYEEWQKWETETKAFYEQCFKTLTDNAKIAEANKVNELIKDVDEELKYLSREFLELKTVDFALDFILLKQDEKHNYYEKKVEEKFSIIFC